MADKGSVKGTTLPDAMRLQQRQRDLERQVAKVHSTVMGIQFQERRLESLENLVLGLQQQVERLAAEQERQADLPTQVNGIVEQVVQDHMASVWEHLGVAQRSQHGLAGVGKHSVATHHDGHGFTGQLHGMSPAEGSQSQALPRDESSNATVKSKLSAQAAEWLPPVANPNSNGDGNHANDGPSSEAPSASNPETVGSGALPRDQDVRRHWPLTYKDLVGALNARDEADALAVLACPDFVDLNARSTPAGHSALYRAAWLGLAKVCQALLERPDFTAAMATDNNGMTALHCAAWRGQLEAVRCLLHHPSTSAAASCRDSLDMLPIHRAAMSGNAEVCRLLLRDSRSPEAELFLAQSKDGNTALHLAAKFGHAEACRAFLEAPNAANAALALRNEGNLTASEVAKGEARKVFKDPMWEGG